VTDGPRRLPPLWVRITLVAGCLALSAPASDLNGQTPAPPLPPDSIRIPRFPLGQTPGALLTGPVRTGQYLGAVGSRAAWLGFETGEGEIWVHPLKIVRDLRLAFQIPGYEDPVPGSRVARRVEVRPGLVTVAYSHAAFQVRQHVLAPRNRPGILMLLEVEAVEPLEIHASFRPVLQYAWPGGMGGQYLYWDGENRVFVLSESLRRRTGVLGSPWAGRGSAHPAHRLAEAPARMVIPVDPARAREEFIPLAVAAGEAPRDEVMAAYRGLLEEAPSLYRENRRWAASLRDRALRLRAHDPEVGEALEWAKINLEEQRSCNPDLGCGLVAGWGPSGTSLRAGFGWYFGGDAAINSLAMDATGQWDLVAEGLRFLARYQREDGKIPHEISQAAGVLPWFEDFPYGYYHADTTPYWMAALWHYWRASGDTALVEELWPAYRKAWEWCLSVETDGDGIIENTTGGLGAIEVGGLGEGIHQDIYLAAVWVKALEGTVEMAGVRGDRDLEARARAILAEASGSLNEAYWREDVGHHAFGILRDGSTNDNLTAWPGTALAFGLLEPARAEETLRRLASDVIASSWGARLLSTESDLYDPLHYNNGAVWPFMTGFVSWGQYRYRRPWAGHPLVHALLELNRAFSLGRHPENLSGAYYQTMDATVPHQFFATSMLVTPLTRGLLGWEPDAPSGRATLAPQPPPSWDSLMVENLPLGDSRIALSYRRAGPEVWVDLDVEGPPVELTYVQSIPLGARNVVVSGLPDGVREHHEMDRHDETSTLVLPLREGAPVHLRFTWEGGLWVGSPARDLPVGAASGGLRVLDFTGDGTGWDLTLEGEGGESHAVTLFGEGVAMEGGRQWRPPGPFGPMEISVSFPPGSGRTVRTLRLEAIR